MRIFYRDKAWWLLLCNRNGGSLEGPFSHKPERVQPHWYFDSSRFSIFLFLRDGRDQFSVEKTWDGQEFLSGFTWDKFMYSVRTDVEQGIRPPKYQKGWFLALGGMSRMSFYGLTLLGLNFLAQLAFIPNAFIHAGLFNMVIIGFYAWLLLNHSPYDVRYPGGYMQISVPFV